MSLWLLFPILHQIFAMLKKILFLLGAALIIIQFIRPAKNQSNNTTNDISTVYTIPADVQQILKTSCYDCHSNYTRYKWYDEIQPVRWWVEDHVKEGKAELNFSEFTTYPEKKRLHKLEEIGDVVDNDEMPLSSYTLAHRDAKLTAAQKEKLTAWAYSLAGK